MFRRARADVREVLKEMPGSPVPEADVAEQFDGEDPTLPDLRQLFAHNREKLEELHAEVQRYAGPFDPSEPDEEQVTKVRGLVEDLVDQYQMAHPGLARYRCAFPDCRRTTRGPEHRAPPCPRFAAGYGHGHESVAPSNAVGIGQITPVSVMAAASEFVCCIIGRSRASASLVVREEGDDTDHHV